MPRIMPPSLLFDPNSFYLGARPIAAQIGSTLAVLPTQPAQATLGHPSSERILQPELNLAVHGELLIS
jgi:hypothetical protein